MKQTRKCFLIATLAANVWACSGNQTPRLSGQRDSLGITVIESTVSAWEVNSGWSVDPVPRLDLATSGTGVQHEFYRVVDATRLGNGDIAVANRGTNEIRVFSATGQFRLSIGRDGDGPGEFRLLATVDRFGDDSLVGFDARIGRMTIASVDGTGFRVVSPYSREVLLRDVYPLTDSTFAAVIFDVRSGADNGRSRPLFHVVRLMATNGMLVDTVVSYPGPELFAFSDATSVGAIAPLFGKSSHVAVSRGQVVVGTADSLEYRVFSGDGRLDRIVRVPGYDLALSPAEVAAERTARLADGASRIPVWRDAIEGLPSPMTRPAYSALVVDTEGFVWLAGHHAESRTGEATDWEVFTDYGRWLGTVRMPPRFTAYEIGVDYVLGRWQDDLDIEHVQLLTLKRG